MVIENMYGRKDLLGFKLLAIAISNMIIDDEMNGLTSLNCKLVYESVLNKYLDRRLGPETLFDWALVDTDRESGKTVANQIVTDIKPIGDGIHMCFNHKIISKLQKYQSRYKEKLSKILSCMDDYEKYL